MQHLTDIQPTQGRFSMVRPAPTEIDINKARPVGISYSKQDAMADQKKEWRLKVPQILMVDDEPVMVQVTLKRLQKAGFRAMGTIDPKEALKWVKDNPDQFDLMITDMVMPKMDGAKLAGEVLKLRPDLPIILCSGYCTLTAEEARRAGIKKFISKPVELSELKAAVQECLEEIGP